MNVKIKKKNIINTSQTAKLKNILKKQMKHKLKVSFYTKINGMKQNMKMMWIWWLNTFIYVCVCVVIMNLILIGKCIIKQNNIKLFLKVFIKVIKLKLIKIIKML